jgi:hypothetical protein
MKDLEKEILDKVKDSIAEAISSSLVGYNSPLSILSKKVIDDNFDDIYGIMNKAFKSVIRTEEFEKTILQEFEHKVAKMLVGQMSGHVEKAVNNIRQDPRLKAKMILAIENIIDNERG